MEESQSVLQTLGGFTKPIGSYRYALFARDEYIGPILLFDTGGQQIGYIYFLTETPSQKTLPPPGIGSDGIVSLYYWIKAFRDVISMLRNEEYKALTWTGDDNSRISTGS
jgi:hypothetical protein